MRVNFGYKPSCCSSRRLCKLKLQLTDVFANDPCQRVFFNDPCQRVIFAIYHYQGSLTMTVSCNGYRFLLPDHHSVIGLKILTVLLHLFASTDTFGLSIVDVNIFDQASSVFTTNYHKLVITDWVKDSVTAPLFQ